jgi:Zn-dependent peptidase ImmA (M78 family)/transcriptional regulator with XRE-family HTH domain
MRSPAATLRAARKSVKLSESMMARLAGIERDQLVRFETGADEIPAAVLERYARIFGLGIRSFLAGGAREAPLGVLFRSMFEGHRPSVGQLASGGTHLVLGEMLRCARDIADLRERLGERREPLTIQEFAPVPVEPGSRTPHGAQELAKRVREHLRLGEGPIPSMVSLVQEKLGIDVLWVTPDELDRDIDAASALAPGPIILVNLVGGAEQWWRTRMTLAHEVCHLLFDRDFLGGKRRQGFVLFSPSPPRGPERSRSTSRSRWYFSDAFENVEQRANAFAAYLLAPPDSVRALVRGMDPRSESAVSALSKEYGVGRETSINLLTNVHRLSRADRIEMMTRPHTVVLDASPEGRFREPISATGMRRGILQDLVLRALAQKRIDPAEARDCLRLSLGEELPPHEGLNEALRAPLLSIEERVRRRADCYLSTRGDTELLYAGSVFRAPAGGYRVEVLAGRGREPFRSVGQLRMTDGLEVVENESRLSLS